MPYIPDPRQALSEGILWQRIRGTPASLIQALGWIGIGAEVDQFNELTDRWPYYELYLAVNILSPDEYRKVLGLAIMSQPVRARLDRIYGIYNRRRFRLDRSKLSEGDLLSDDSGVTPPGDPNNPQVSFGAIDTQWIQVDRAIVSGTIASDLPTWTLWTDAFYLDWHELSVYQYQCVNSPFTLNTWRAAYWGQDSEYLPGWAPDLGWQGFNWSGVGIIGAVNCRMTLIDTRPGMYTDVWAKVTAAAALTSIRTIGIAPAIVHATPAGRVQSVQALASAIAVTVSTTNSINTLAGGALGSSVRVVVNVGAALQSVKLLTANIGITVSAVTTITRAIHGAVSASTSASATLFAGGVNYPVGTVVVNVTCGAALQSVKLMTANVGVSTSPAGAMGSTQLLAGNVGVSVTPVGAVTSIANGAMVANVGVNVTCGAVLQSVKALVAGVAVTVGDAGVLQSTNALSATVTTTVSPAGAVQSVKAIVGDVGVTATCGAALQSVQLLTAGVQIVGTPAGTIGTGTINNLVVATVATVSPVSSLQSVKLITANVAVSASASATLQSINRVSANISVSVNLGSALTSINALSSNVQVIVTTPAYLTRVNYHAGDVAVGVSETVTLIHTGATWQPIAWENTNYTWSD